MVGRFDKSNDAVKFFVNGIYYTYYIIKLYSETVHNTVPALVLNIFNSYYDHSCVRLLSVT